VRIVSERRREVRDGARSEPVRSEDFGKWGLETMIQAEGVAYGGYHRLNVGALTDEIARLITRVAGFDLQSDEFQAIRYLVREWRDEYYRAYRGEQETPDSTEQGSEEKQTQNEFLMQYDLAYRIRRLDFVLNRIDRLYGLDQQAARTLEDLNIKPIPRGGRETEVPDRALAVNLQASQGVLGSSRRRGDARRAHRLDAFTALWVPDRRQGSPVQKFLI
jgi:hypothetical protein